MSSDIRSTSELLPWLVPLTDSIVICKDSGLMAVFEYRGLDADNADPSDVAEMAEAAERMIHQLQELPVTLWWTLKRERTEDYPGEEMPDPVARMLDEEHRQIFLRSAAYVNRYFFTIHWLPANGVDNFFEKVGQQTSDGHGLPSAIWGALRSSIFSKQAFKWHGEQLERGLLEFQTKLAQIQNIMSVAQFKPLNGQDLMGFLYAMANPGKSMVPKEWDADSYLDAYLPEQPITVNDDSLVFGDTVNDQCHVSALSMKSWPGALQFACFDALTTPPCEMVISHCFQIMSKAKADLRIGISNRINDFLQYPLTEWIAGSFFRRGQYDTEKANPARRQAVADALVATGELTKGSIIFGNHNITMLIQGRTRIECEDYMGVVKKMIESSPFVGVVREHTHLLSAWATTLPGQWQECRRWLPITSQNLVYMAPLLCVEQGQRYNDHLSDQLREPCQALTVLSTDKNTPFFLNFHDGALGHTAVIGPSRTGKSIAMNFFISQFRKYKRSRIIIFDKDYSCRQPTLLQGGEYVDLRPGSGIKMNPISLVTDAASWSFLSTWVESLATARGYRMSADEATAIFAAIEQTAHMAPELHQLRTVVNLLPRSLQAQMQEWVGGGKNAGYFDNIEDSYSLSRFCATEMGYIMQEPTIARAFLEYAFYRIAKQLRDQVTSPDGIDVTMIYVEECWFLLAEPVFAMRLMDWLKTLAKLNAFVVLCTQSLEDLGNVPETVWAALRDNIATHIFLPNRKADEAGLKDLYTNKFGLREDHVRRIKKAQRRRDYFFVQQDVKRMLSMSLSRRQVAALRSDAAAQAIFSRYYQDQMPGWQMAYIDEVMEAA